MEPDEVSGDAGVSDLVDKATSATYQAENHTFQRGCARSTTHAGYTGSGFMDFGGNGSILEWQNVSVPAAGQYTLVFRYANGSTGSRPCAMTVNDTQAGNVTFAQTGGWATWKTQSIKVSLRQGNNRIRVTANTGSGGPNLDKMDVMSEGGGTGPGGQCSVVNEGATANLSCPSGQVIASITFASYGTPRGTCPSLSSTACDAPTSKSRVESQCLGKQTCSVGASNTVFGDPCAGTPKKLAVAYSCSGGTSAGTCAQGCAAPTPICGPDSKCTATRWVEPISTLPSKWKATIDTKLWTKWVRSVIPVLGQASTQNAALLEVAYYAERIHMPRGQVLVPDLINSMLGAHPTFFSVYPACPRAFMHPSVKPTMSSGGGGWTNTIVSEDWVLRYPKCTGKYAVACDAIPAGVLCNNCQWQNGAEKESCRDTLAHEHGHTCDLHRRNYLDSSVDAIAKRVFPSNDIEGPAWSASAYFMNPSLESAAGRDRGQRIMSSQEMSYWSVTQKFTMSKYPAGWGYALKTTRCPQMGLTEACPDTLTRTYAVPLDSWR
jgi:hypothetical protein